MFDITPVHFLVTAGIMLVVGFFAGAIVQDWTERRRSRLHFEPLTKEDLFGHVLRAAAAKGAEAWVYVGGGAHAHAGIPKHEGGTVWSLFYADRKNPGTWHVDLADIDLVFVPLAGPMALQMAAEGKQ